MTNNTKTRMRAFKNVILALEYPRELVTSVRGTRREHPGGPLAESHFKRALHTPNAFVGTNRIARVGEGDEPPHIRSPLSRQAP